MLVLAKADAVHDVLRAGIITSGTLSQCPLRRWQPARHAAFISRGAAVSQSVRERGRQREREREGERGKRADSVL